MTSFAPANDLRSYAKALKVVEEATRANVLVINSWEEELTAQSCAPFPGDISPRNSDEVPSDRNYSWGLDPAPREDGRALLEVDIFVDKPGYLALSSASRVEDKNCRAQSFVMNFVIRRYGSRRRSQQAANLLLCVNIRQEI